MSRILHLSRLWTENFAQRFWLSSHSWFVSARLCLQLAGAGCLADEVLPAVLFTWRCWEHQRVGLWDVFLPGRKLQEIPRSFQHWVSWKKHWGYWCRGRSEMERWKTNANIGCSWWKHPDHQPKHWTAIYTDWHFKVEQVSMALALESAKVYIQEGA